MAGVLWLKETLGLLGSFLTGPSFLSRETPPQTTPRVHTYTIRRAAGST